MKRHVHGWTVIRNEEAWKRWLKRRMVTYPGLTPCYPCLARDAISSDENSQGEYLSAKELHDMQQALLPHV